MEAVSTVHGVLELLDRAGRVEQRVAVGDAPVRIGRAFDNDVIVDDAHVDAYHAMIAPDNGVPLLRDLGSVNGIRAGNGRNRARELKLDRDVPFKLGTTTLRYRPAADATTAAMPLREVRFIARPSVWAAIGVVACLSALIGGAALSSTERFGGLQMLNVALWPAIAIIVWSALWSLIGRVLVHQARFLAHVAVVSLGSLIGSVLVMLGHLAAFAFALDNAVPWFGAIALLISTFLILSGHLRLATRLSRRVALTTALTICVLFVGATQVARISMFERFFPAPRVAVTLAPPGTRLRSPQSADAFYARTQALVDALRDEPPPKSTKDN